MLCPPAVLKGRTYVDGGLPTDNLWGQRVEVLNHQSFQVLRKKKIRRTACACFVLRSLADMHALRREAAMQDVLGVAALGGRTWGCLCRVLLAVW